MILIPFSFSITQGILWGILWYGILAFVTKQWRQHSTFFKGLWFLSIALIWLENI